MASVAVGAERRSETSRTSAAWPSRARSRSVERAIMLMNGFKAAIEPMSGMVVRGGRILCERRVDAAAAAAAAGFRTGAEPGNDMDGGTADAPLIGDAACAGNDLPPRVPGTGTAAAARWACACA